jgi:hypothetical protein
MLKAVRPHTDVWEDAVVVGKMRGSGGNALLVLQTPTSLTS